MLLLLMMIMMSSAASQYLENTTYDMDVSDDGGDLQWQFWRNISSGDPIVQTLWRTNEIYNIFSRFDEWVLDCLNEFRDIKKAAAPFLVMTSLKSNTYFLEKLIYYDISSYSKRHELQKLNRLHHYYLQLVHNFRTYREAAYGVIQNMEPEVQYKLECPSTLHCGCLSSQDVRDFQVQFLDLTSYHTDITSLVIVCNYVDPILRAIVTFAGLLLNISLLKMIILKKDLRTESNVIVINLVVNDILYIVVYIPIQYVHYYYYDVFPHEYFSYNVVYIAIESTLFSVSAFSILALYFQRYFATWSKRTFSVRNRIVLCILIVWVSALIVMLLVCMLNIYRVGGLEINSVSGVYLSLLKGLPVTMFILDKLTARKVKKLDEDGQAEFQQFISSKLTRTLCLVYWFTHTPMFMWLCVEKGVGLLSIKHRFNYTYIELASYYLLFLYPILNAIIIFRILGSLRCNLSSCCRKRQTENDPAGADSCHETIDTSI